MTQPWFSDKRTRLSIETPGTTNISFQETHAQNIFERYFQLNKTSAVDATLYGKKNHVTQDWLNTVLNRGTSTDKVLAFAFLVKSKPKRSMRHLESLLSLISPAKKQTCLKAIDVLTNLFETVILPNTRTLIAFEYRPFDSLSKYPAALSDDLSLLKGSGDLPAHSREYVLCMWYFENQIKQIYFRFLTSLENVLMSDTIPTEKNKALNSLVNLVSHKPEARETIFGILVNKLGDRSKTVASSVIHKLRGLISQRSNLKAMLVDQLRSFLFRTNLVDRAKYYSIVLLSSVPLTKGGKGSTEPGDGNAEGEVDESTASLSAILFKVYLSFFRASVEADELPERLTTALLTGISRVAPYLSGELMASNVTDIDAVFRLVHVTTNFTICLQALTFLFHFTSHQTQLRDRYCQALYRKLSDQSVRWTSRGPSILHLVYRSLIEDKDIERKAAFVQRLLGICLSHPEAGFVAAVQIMLEKIRTATQQTTPLICLTHSTKPSQKIKADTTRKMLLPTAIGVVKQTIDSDSDEEHFSDVLDSDEEVDHKTSNIVHTAVSAAWDHIHLIDNQHKKKKILKTKKNKTLVNGEPGASKSTSIGFDFTARDPRFAKAANEPCWQLILLTRHAHPTVSLFARNTMIGKLFKYTGNPFDDLSVNHFIERFVYKKPKSGVAASKSKEAISKQSTKKMEIQAGKQRVLAKTLSVDSPAYRNLAPNQIPSDEQFIHNYFNFVGKKDEKKVNESDESDIDDEFDDYLRKHEKGLVPDNLDEEEEYGEDEDFNYSTDEEEQSAEEEIGNDHDDVDASDMDDNHDSVTETEEERENSDPEEIAGKEDDDDDNEEDDFSMSGDDAESEDEFGPPSKRHKSGKFDMNKLFVSADEVGELYDTQDSSNKKQSKWQNQRLSISSSKPGANKLRSKRKRCY